MKRRDRASIAAALLLASAIAAAPAALAGDVTIVDAGPQTPGSATPQTLPAIAAPPISSLPPVDAGPSSDTGDPIQLHADRVDALSNLARSLYSVCSAPPSDDKEAKAVMQKASERAIAIRKGIVALEKRKKKLEQEASQHPNDVKIIAALALLAKDKKAIEDAAQREAKGRADQAALDTSALRGSLCAELCSGQDSAQSPVNLCAFRSPVLTNAAAISDFGSAAGLAAYVERKFDAIRVVLGDKSTLSLGELEEADPDLPERIPMLYVKRAAGRFSAVKHTGFDVAAFSAGALDIGVRALASVIIDRARRESLAYFLERLHAEVCGPEKPDPRDEASIEIRAHWLPTTCSLAERRLEFMQYSGGAELLGALRGAIAADVRKWPASALGLGFGLSLWGDLSVGVKGGAASMFSCVVDPAKPNAGCGAEMRLRASAERLVTELGAGGNAALALYNFGVDIDTLNVAVSAGVPRGFHSERLALAACAASIPLAFQEYGGLVRETKLGRNDASKALLLAAITSSPACFSLVGRGFSQESCPGFSADTNAGASVCAKIDPAKPGDTLRLALEARPKLEKLTTIARWASAAEAPAVTLSTRWNAVVDAFTAYRAAAKAMQEPQAPAVNISPPEIQIGAGFDAKAVADTLRGLDAYTRDAGRLSEQSGRLRLLQASALLARASLDLARAFAEIGGASPEAALFPGLCVDGACSAEDITRAFLLAQAEIARLSASVEIVEAVIVDDWGKVIAKVIAELRADLPRTCVTPECKEQCSKQVGPCAVIDRLARHAGLFSTLAFETDTTRVSAALESAAMPVGGYRRKNIDGSFTVSLGSFPGLVSGGELRFGTYAGVKEAGNKLHAVAPTLSMPVGVDFAKGFGSYNLGAFISAIDPAAYLQYDAEQGGRLPGAQILTLLAPGAYLRASILDSPFTLGLFGVYRPGLRAMESSVTTPGAHALQLGLSLSIDVTLYDLFTGAPKIGE